MPESKKRKVVAARERRREMAGNQKRYRQGQPIPALQFGQHGELTPRTIKQANLTPEEEERAYEMLEVQAAYVQILEALSFPVDPEGHVHDLTALGPTKVAIAWTLALNGVRFTGPKYIKKRGVTHALYKDAHTWVDMRAPDDAADELQPEHSADDYRLPPDTRRLAAVRDGAPGQQLPPGWSVKPEVVWDDEPRPVPDPLLEMLKEEGR
jgi:hypothetical protein